MGSLFTFPDPNITILLCFVQISLALLYKYSSRASIAFGPISYKKEMILGNPMLVCIYSLGYNYMVYCIAIYNFANYSHSSSSFNSTFQLLCL